ncbi:MAG: histidine kinase [bacterium]|nr:MAG: histidine kinase [bacterium]
MIKTNIADRVEDLPMLSNTFNEISRVADNPHSTSREISTIVERDQVITTKVLKLINSAFYGIPRRITMLEQAITLLGTSAVKNLILGGSVFQAFGGSADLRGLWVHAFAVATGAKIIGQKINYREIEELFICGLLHDIGKLAEYLIEPDAVNAVREKSLSEKMFFWQAEEELFETGHERIGQRLLTRWKLPDKYCKVVAFHHKPHAKRDYALETAAVYTADALARSLNLGDSWDNNLVPKIDGAVIDVLDIDVMADEEIKEAVIEQTEEVLQIFMSDKA